MLENNRITTCMDSLIESKNREKFAGNTKVTCALIVPYGTVIHVKL